MPTTRRFGILTVAEQKQQAAFKEQVRRCYAISPARLTSRLAAKARISEMMCLRLRGRHGRDESQESVQQPRQIVRKASTQQGIPKTGPLSAKPHHTSLKKPLQRAPAPEAEVRDTDVRSVATQTDDSLNAVRIQPPALSTYQTASYKPVSAATRAAAHHERFSTFFATDPDIGQEIAGAQTPNARSDDAEEDHRVKVKSAWQGQAASNTRSSVPVSDLRLRAILGDPRRRLPWDY